MSANEVKVTWQSEDGKTQESTGVPTYVELREDSSGELVWNLTLDSDQKIPMTRIVEIADPNAMVLTHMVSSEAVPQGTSMVVDRHNRVLWFGPVTLTPYKVANEQGACVNLNPGDYAVVAHRVGADH